MQHIHPQFNEKWCLLLDVSREDFSLPDARVRWQGKTFDPKPELHVTLVGKDLGEKIAAKVKAAPGLAERLQGLAREASLLVGQPGKLHHASAEKTDKNDQPLHAESIIQMVEVPGLETFCQRLKELTGELVEIPPTHVTLYTLGDPDGIGLPDKAAFDEFVTGEIQVEDLEMIPTLEQLRALLLSNGVDLSAWGQGGFKTIEHLLREIEAGETRLQGPPFQGLPLMRVVSVVCLKIRKGNAYLIEAKQLMADGRERLRNRTPCEKVRPGESLPEAAVRCLVEEMGLARERIHILEDSCQKSQEIKDANSYPGLQACYLFYNFEARVDGLSDTDFETEESANNPDDPVRKHYWSWVTDQ